MVTNLEKIPINDNTPASRNVAGQEFVQGADTLFAQGVIPMQTIIDETTGINLTTSNTDTAISPLANLVVIDFGTNNPVGQIRLSGQHRSGGDFHKIDFWSAAPQEELPRRRRYSFQATYSNLNLYQYTNALDGSRIVYIPSAGLQTVRLALAGGTLADVRILQICTPAMPPRPRRADLIGLAFGDFTIANSLYTTGDAIDTVASMTVSNAGPQFGTNEGVTTIRALTGADYDNVLTDFDLVLTGANQITPQTDNAPFDFDYVESVIAWFEMRTSPTGDQIPIRNFGSGGNGFFINDLNIHVPYTNVFASDHFWAFDAFAIDRSGMTGTPTTVYLEAQVEM